jgi:hypothetical protein
MSTEKLVTKPITPADAENKSNLLIPEFVIQVVNDLIIKNYKNRSARISQEEIVIAIVEKGHVRKRIFSEGWLDFESVYQKAGWNVNYDRPGHNETYPATFTFKHSETH